MTSLILLTSFSLAFLCICQADLISNVCSKAANPTLCTQTLTSDPLSRRADLKGLGQIVIEKAKAATQGAIEVVKSSRTEDIVNICVETSNNAIDDLNECSQLLSKFNKSSKAELLTKGSGALTNIETCDEAFEVSEPPKVKVATKRAKDIIDVLLVIADGL